jgi:hypothetical protein
MIEKEGMGDQMQFNAYGSNCTVLGGFHLGMYIIYIKY